MPGTEPRLASSLQDQARNIRAMSYDERDDPRDGGDDPYGGGAAWNTNTLGGAPGGANRPRLGGVAGTGRGLRRGISTRGGGRGEAGAGTRGGPRTWTTA